MAETIQMVGIRNFPVNLHRRAKIQAVTEGISLKDLFIKAVTEYLERHEKKQR
jgi:predicted HicB family RNase H-like nuclease